MEGERIMRSIEIKTETPLTVAGIAHKGPYAQIGRAFDQLHGLCGQRGLYGPASQLVAVYYDEAAITPPAQQRALAGITVAEGTPVEPPLQKETLDGGAYAVLRHLGPYAELGASYDWLFGTWLPQSGREAADRPCFEIYRNTPMDTAPEDLITDIYLPLRPAR
jgi:AraC family transcriptional regulator